MVRIPSFPFSISYKAGLVLKNSGFCLGMSSPFLKESFPKQIILNYQVWLFFLFFQHFEYITHSLLTYEVPAIESADSLISNDLSLSFQILFSTWQSMLLNLYWIFQFHHCILQLKGFCLGFYSSISLLNFSFVRALFCCFYLFVYAHTFHHVWV